MQVSMYALFPDSLRHGRVY
ncbi:hypothetical protein F383_29538 [Gossypium arboreum]|uniref:Uncharacterized protein n=1 Tax=Gossypium arboreum TaxID=29729 RepID=A0A0B0PKN6_GOSAR|nr:hypothetical protein F383_29538 [Gossypium arboreum]